MKKNFLLLMLVSNFAFAQKEKENQNIWRLTIVDGFSLKGIDRATVSIDKTNYFITDEKGLVEINTRSINSTDSINISCIGYKPLALAPGINFKYPDTLKLSAATIDLNEVNVHSSGSPEIKIGDIKKSFNTHRVPNPDEENAQYIPNDKKVRGIITSVQYVLNDELHGIEKPFAVRLYSKSKTSLFPDKKLIKDSLIVYNTGRKQMVTVDISKYNIPFPDNGVIVVFATLPRSYYGKDSVWYDKKPQGKRWFLKMPGIDMDLKKKDDYPADYSKSDRKGPYSMVRSGEDKLNFADIKDQFYVFGEGNNFAISITVAP